MYAAVSFIGLIVYTGNRGTLVDSNSQIDTDCAHVQKPHGAGYISTSYVFRNFTMDRVSPTLALLSDGFARLRLASVTRRTPMMNG